MDPRKLTLFGALIVLCAGLITYLAVAQEDGTSVVPPAQDDKEKPEISEAGHPIERVKVGGKEFRLEVVSTDITRFKGLSDREKVAEDGGMLFVFPRSKVAVHEFVMRDCLTDIDIIFLDPRLRITKTHHMSIEEPRRVDEPKPIDSSRQRDLYAERLKKYSSSFPNQYVIELRGGMLEKLREDPEIAKQLEIGQVIELDTRKLLRKAR